jgi:hypothetical protein
MRTEQPDKIYTSKTVTPGTTFYLQFEFSGESDNEQGCQLKFNIFDLNQIYHVDFRIRKKNHHKKLVQGTNVKGIWQDQLASYEEMNMVQGENNATINVGPNYFKVRLNGRKFKESIAVNPDRLSKYSHLSIERVGSCISIELEKSYVRYTHGKHSYYTTLSLR